MRTGPSIALGPATARPFAAERMMACRVEITAPAAVPAHAHEHEQLLLVERGRLRVTVDHAEPFEVADGHLAHFPSGARHGVEVLEDAVFWDVFCPVREDFLELLDRPTPAESVAGASGGEGQ
jgi:quercetin dioxygenase-like cupin family protein